MNTNDRLVETGKETHYKKQLKNSDPVTPGKKHARKPEQERRLGMGPI